MSKFKYYSTKQLVNFFIAQGKEGECWDFKQEWHDNIADLVKDIICFANTTHDENCYLIFGVSNDLQVVGMKKPRTKQADIIDSLSNLNFAGDIIPKIEVETIDIDGVEIDVLIIFDVKNPPVYLKKTYGKMREGCIYLRNGDKNTPDNGNADIEDIENLWRKRLGLTKPPLEIIFDRMHNKLEWTEQDDVFYNIYRPEYVIEIIDEEEDDLEAEFYAYAMTNSNTSYRNLNIKYQSTILDSYQLVILDGGRLQIPVPEWGYVCHNDYGINAKYCYKYYIAGTCRYRLLSFLYDEQNSDERFAFMHLNDVVLHYHSGDEKLAFESFVEGHQEIFEKYLNGTNRYNHINTGEPTKTKVYKERLHTGIALNKLLEDWRDKNIKT